MRGERMTSARRRAGELRWLKIPAWRRAIVFLVAAAFFFQSYVTQTHVHPAFTGSVSGASASLDAAAVGKLAAQSKQRPPGDRIPANDDPAKCPLCQAVGHAGQFFSPSAVAILLPTQTASVIELSTSSLIATERASHNWQGRAPPSA